MAKERLHYIDIFKGICLILVVIHHAPLAYMGHFAQQGSVLWYINNFAIAFFMPAFFVATGYCTNFNQRFKVYLLKNIKAIMLPCYCLYYLNRYINNLNTWLFEDASWLTLSHWLAPGIRTFVEEGGFYWFLSALFIAKLLMYLLLNIKSKLYQTIGAVSFMLVGTYLYQYNILPNKFFYQHAFILVSFMFFGRILKEHEMKINSIAKRISVPFVLFVLFLPLIGIDIPTVTRTITVKLFTLPLFVVLSLGGSIIVWYLSRLISKSNWLEYIGKGSLVEYCFNYATLCFIANIYKETLKMVEGDLFITDSMACLIIASVTIMILPAFYWVLDHKYIKVIIGKF